MACKAICLSFIVTLSYPRLSICEEDYGSTKHKENVKDYQKRMEEQVQSLIDKTRAAFPQGKIPPAPFSIPLPAGAMIPPPPSVAGLLCPGMMPAPHPHGSPSHDASDGPPPPWMMPMGTAPGMRPPMGGHMPMTPGPQMMSPPACPHDGAHSAWDLLDR